MWFLTWYLQSYDAHQAWNKILLCMILGIPHHFKIPKKYVVHSSNVLKILRNEYFKVFLFWIAQPSVKVKKILLWISQDWDIVFLIRRNTRIQLGVRFQHFFFDYRKLPLIFSWPNQLNSQFSEDSTIAPFKHELLDFIFKKCLCRIFRQRSLPGRPWFG